MRIESKHFPESTTTLLPPLGGFCCNCVAVEIELNEAGVAANEWVPLAGGR